MLRAFVDCSLSWLWYSPYACTPGYQSIPLLMGVCILSSFGLLMPLRTFLYMSFGSHGHSFLLGLYLQMGLVGHGVGT